MSEGIRIALFILLFTIPLVGVIALGTFWEKRRFNVRLHAFAQAHGWMFTKDLSWIGTVHPFATGSIDADHTAVLRLASGGTYTVVTQGVAGMHSTVFTTFEISGPRVDRIGEVELRSRSGMRKVSVKNEEGRVVIFFPFALATKRQQKQVEALLSVVRELLQ